MRLRPLLTLLLIGAVAVATAPAAAAAPRCNWRPPAGKLGPPLHHPVKLVPDISAQTVNFGGARGTKYVDVVLSATPALPAGVRANQLKIGILRRFTRASQTLPSESAPAPTFTAPRISAARDRVSFTVCMRGAGLDAGSYGGSVIVEGPKGLAPTTLSITENAKNDKLALWLAIGVLTAAFVFLLLRGAAARQLKDEQDALDAAAKQGDPNLVMQLHQNPRQHHIAWYFAGVVRDLNWWVTTLVGLGVAAGSIIAIYSANPAWGADMWSSVAALIGPVFTAVGVQSMVTTLGRTASR